MSDSLQLAVIYEQGGDGWIIATIPDVPGTMSQGPRRRRPEQT